MASVAGARRTQSSYPVFLASTNPSDLSLGTALYSPALGPHSGFNPQLVRRIAGLKGVRHVESWVAATSGPVGANGSPIDIPVTFNAEASVDGEYFNQDRLSVVQGRMANPDRADEAVMTASAEQELHMHVGEVVPWAFYPNSQTYTLGAGTPPAPYLKENVKIVGTVVFNDEVVQSDVDAGNDNNVVFTPALARRVTSCCSSYTFSFLQLRHGPRDIATVEREIESVMPPSLPYDFHLVSIVETEAVRSIKPESVALGFFGGVAAFAALLIAAQTSGRQLRLGARDLATMRALGATPVMAVADGALPVVMATLLGALLALAVAVALSPLSPLGPVRYVYPTRGISFDWTVLGAGPAILFVVPSALTLLFAYRGAPHRAAARREIRGSPRQGVARSRWARDLPAPARIGLLFALDPGAGTDAVPVRSVISGAALSVLAVVGTVTFGSSLDRLVSHPALYGWDWSYELSGGGGVGDIPPAQSATLLKRDHDVSAWSSYYFGTMQIDGQTVPAMGTTPHPAVEPPILSGHGFDGVNQVVLGAGTLASLHKHVGDTVQAQYGATKATTLRVVGTATMPTVGLGGVAQHPTMGTGAILSYRLIPEAVWDSFQNSPAGPNAIFVRLRPGVGPGAARSLQYMASRLTLRTNYGVTVSSVQRPAEIVNYRSMGTTPTVLALGLAVGAVVALALNLMASVRRRRRELAMLKTLGFTNRQVATVVSLQSTATALMGTVIGIPLGIILGRYLWDVFAHQIDAVPQPAVPALSLVVIGLGAIVLSNLVAVVPGRVAGRTSTAVALRTE